MAFKFPFSTLHELNLDWILDKVKTFAELIPPMETAVEDVQSLSTDVQQAVEDAQQALEDAGEALQTAEEAKEIAEQAAQGTIADGAVTTAKIADGAVTTAKLADGAVTGNKIDIATIQTGNLSEGCVTSNKILDGTIVTADLHDGSVTDVKLSQELQTSIYNSEITWDSTHTPWLIKEYNNGVVELFAEFSGTTSGMWYQLAPSGAGGDPTGIWGITLPAITLPITLQSDFAVLPACVIGSTFCGAMAVTKAQPTLYIQAWCSANVHTNYTLQVYIVGKKVT